MFLELDGTMVLEAMTLKILIKATSMDEVTYWESRREYDIESSLTDLQPILGQVTEWIYKEMCMVVTTKRLGKPKRCSKKKK